MSVTRERALAQPSELEIPRGERLERLVRPIHFSEGR